LGFAGIRIMPTRGFLINFKRRVKSIEEGYKLLEMKRDELAAKLRQYLEQLRAAKKDFIERSAEIMKKFREVYALIGPDKIDALAASISKLEIKVLPISIMGIHVPEVKLEKLPEIKNKYPPIVRAIAHQLYEMLDDLIKITELEMKIEIIAYDLEKTNRIVNALEKIVIPEMKRIVKMIEDMLDEDELEEFIRLKIIRNKILGKREKE